MDDKLPAELRLTPLHRSLADAIGLTDQGIHDQNPTMDEAARAIAVELKALRRKVNFLYVATALGAFIVLQPARGELSIEAMGFKIPLSMLSKQALAVLLSAAYGYYVAGLVSFALLYGTFSRLFSRTAPEGWEFLAARYDADMIWTTLLRPKQLGYTARRAEAVISGIVRFSNFAVVLSHTAVVVGAITIAGLSAYAVRSWFGMALAVLALIGAGGAIIGAYCVIALKLKYKAPAAARMATKT